MTNIRTGENTINMLVTAANISLQQNKQHKKKRVKPEYSRFKMKIYWRIPDYDDPDKNGQPMYSYDYFYKHIDTGKIRVENEREGLAELINEARKQRAADSFVSLVIWCCVRNEKHTATSQYNCEVVKMIRNKSQIWYNPTLEFIDGKLNLKKIKLISNKDYFK